jgi:hypothetical protein
VGQFEFLNLRGVIPKSRRFYQRAEGPPVAHSMVVEILRFAGRTATLRMTPSTSEDAFRDSS